MGRALTGRTTANPPWRAGSKAQEFEKNEIAKMLELEIMELA